MCGILAVYCKFKEKNTDLIRKAHVMLSNRGPDDEKMIESPHILCFRRAIVAGFCPHRCHRADHFYLVESIPEQLHYLAESPHHRFYRHAGDTVTEAGRSLALDRSCCSQNLGKTRHGPCEKCGRATRKCQFRWYGTA